MANDSESPQGNSSPNMSGGPRTVTAVVGGTRRTKIVGFSADTCDFDANIKVEF